MKNSFLILLTYIFFSGFHLMPSVSAANILGVCSTGASATFCNPNKLYFPCYPNSSGTARVEYKLDPSALGDFSAAQAAADAEDMLDVWEGVAAINFARKSTGFISQDVNSSNYTQYLEAPSPLGYSPIIFDQDGDIVENYFGRGSRTSVLGFAGASFYNQDENNGAVDSILESQSLYNGYLFNLDNLFDNTTLEETRTEFKTTILHEFAHMVGLDHSQGGEIDNFYSSDASLEHFPVMFPIVANPLIELQRDDIAAINLCYPRPGYAATTASLSGTFKKSNGTAIKGANVVAYNIDNPEEEVVSSASDHLGQGDGSFLLAGLTPGDYILKVEPLDSNFTGGSSVGIHYPSSSSGIVTGFYLGDNAGLLATDDLSTGLLSAERISVSAGDEITGLRITTASVSGDGASADVSFKLGGRAVTRLHAAAISKVRTVKLKIKKKGKGTRTLSLETNYPDLVSFPKGSTVNFSNRKRNKKIKIELASFEDFLDTIDDFESRGLDIQLTVTDLDTGYVDNSSTISVF